MRKGVRRSLYIALGVALFVVIWVLAFSIDREYQRSTDLGGGVVLVETVHIFRSAYTEIADSGGSAWLPMPFRSESVIHQKVLRNGAVLWEGPPDKTYNASVSPDHHYLLVWPQVHTEWWRVYDLSTGNYIEVYRPKDLPGMADYMVPLKFGRWSDDSQRILAVIEGTEIERPNNWMKYRETYLVDPSNGDLYKQNHCHQPVPDDQKPVSRLNWDNSPCAGKYED